MRRHSFLKDLILVEMGLKKKRMENEKEILWPSRRCSSRDMHQNSVFI
jgi:hypothetical protein